MELINVRKDKLVYLQNALNKFVGKTTRMITFDKDIVINSEGKLSQGFKITEVELGQLDSVKAFFKNEIIPSCVYMIFIDQDDNAASIRIGDVVEIHEDRAIIHVDPLNSGIVYTIIFTEED